MNKIMIPALLLIIALGYDSSAGAMMRTKEGQKKLAEKMSESKKAKEEKELKISRKAVLDKIHSLQVAFSTNVPYRIIKDLLIDFRQSVPLLPWLQEPIDAYLNEQSLENKKALIDALKQASNRLFELLKKGPHEKPETSRLVPLTKPGPAKPKSK